MDCMMTACLTPPSVHYWCPLRQGHGLWEQCTYKWQLCHSSHQPLMMEVQTFSKGWILTQWLTKKSSLHSVVIISYTAKRNLNPFNTALQTLMNTPHITHTFKVFRTMGLPKGLKQSLQDKSTKMCVADL
jgi:hypothetical protein